MAVAQSLNRPIVAERVIRKSRFLACVEPIQKASVARERLRALRALHPSAAHICFAQVLHGQISLSDDGEPSGTAARPMLNVLQHQGLDNVLASVVRYFGGIKLGAGGLVRAYSQAVSVPLHDPVNAHCLSLVIPQRTLCIVLPFEVESLARRSAKHQGLQLHADYPGDRVQLQVQGDAPAVAIWLDALQEPAQGAMQVLADSDFLE